MKWLYPHAATTRGITVRVSVSFWPEQSEPQRGRWFWAYQVRIENEGDQPVQLVSRHWIIVDGRGTRQEVKGEGVVGAQPIIAPGESYDYVSSNALATASGWMEGSYTMIAADGSMFRARIPRFPLVGPAVAQ